MTKNKLFLHPLISIETKDGSNQIMGGYYGSVKATTESLVSALSTQYDVHINPASYYNHVSGKDEGPLQLGNTAAAALTAAEVDNILQQPGKHVFIGAGKIAQADADDLGSLASAEFVLTNKHNAGQAHFTFIADLNTSEKLVEDLANKNPGKLIYTWPEMSQQKSDYYSNTKTSCKFMPLPGRPVKADYGLFQKTYESFSGEHKKLFESQRPLVVIHIPGNAGGIPFTPEQAKAYTQNLISRHKEKSPVYMAIQGNRTDNAVLEAMQETFTENNLLPYEKNSENDCDFVIFDKKSNAYKTSFLVSEMTDRDVTIEIDVNSSAITGELNFASSSNVLLISTPGVLQYTKALNIMNFYSDNGLDVIQENELENGEFNFEMKKGAFKENGRDNLDGARIAEKFGKLISAHIN